MQYKLADAALTTWGERMIKEMSSGLGYPSSTAEGRAQKNGPGRTDHVFTSIVPRLSDWEEIEVITHKGILAMPANLRSACIEKYVTHVLSKKTARFSSGKHALFLYAKIWLSGWLCMAAINRGDK